MTDIIADVGSGGPFFNLFDPQWSSDPFPLYADLRARAPIHHKRPRRSGEYVGSFESFEWATLN